MKPIAIDYLIDCIGYLVILPYAFIIKVDDNDIVDFIQENWWRKSWFVITIAKILFWRKCKKVGIEKSILDITELFRAKSEGSVLTFKEFLMSNKKYKAAYEKIMILQ